MTTFATLDALLHHAGNGRRLTEKKVGNNTIAIRRDDDTIAIRLHATDVVTFHSDGTLMLDSGGWYSVTTKARMNEYANPFSVYSKRGVWHVYANGDDIGAYYDGITLDPANPVPIETPADVVAARDTDRETMKGIAAYLRGLTRERWADVMADARANGTAGDCWYCTMVTDDGTALGNAIGDHGHLREHVRERYYMATLAYAALKESGYREPVFVIDHVDMVKRSLRRYLKARLLVGNTGDRKPTAAIGDGWSNA